MSLGLWVKRQRNDHISNKIRIDRKGLLDKIGFAWKDDGTRKLNRLDKLWHQQYENLVDFKRKTGHCLVPRRHEQEKSLGRWVGTQRSDHKNNIMLPDRKEALDQIDFVWNVKDHQWRLRHDELVAFKRQHQHCLRPFSLSRSFGLTISGPIMQTTNFDLIGRQFWTKSGSLGKLTPLQHSLLPMM